MHDLNVGDKVTIRGWDDMEEEFGMGGLGIDIADCAFRQRSRGFCGKEAVVTGVREPRSWDTVTLDIDDYPGWLYHVNALLMPSK